MRTIQIFLGGGVKLLHGEDEFHKGYRNDVIDPIISQLNSLEYTNHLFVARDYSDLTRNVVKGKQQEVYNDYIIQKAEIALFIIDGEIGNITKHEINIAVASTKKKHHPIVYIYGKNINNENDIVSYLNQEGIYFQHFYSNWDLATKIKADLDAAVKLLDRRKNCHIWMSLLLLFCLCGSLIFFLKTCFAKDENPIDDCTAQLYLMRYHDVNVLSGNNIFDSYMLSTFKYEDSLMIGDDVSVFPVLGKTSEYITAPPFFRIKLHNKNRNTIVFVEGYLEVDQYSQDTIIGYRRSLPRDLNLTNVNVVNINSTTNEYILRGFRQNVAYGECDDRYYFSVSAKENCTFRMRIKVKSQLGDYLYSNYIYVKYMK